MESRLIRVFAAFVVLSLGTAGCSTETDDTPPAQAPQATPVQTALAPSLTMAATKLYTGRLEAEKMIAVQPLLSGQILEVALEDGALVKQGDVLFEIHSSRQRARLAELKAELESKEAQVELAKRDLERARSLRKNNAISQEQLDNRSTEVTKAIADAAALAAAVEGAQVIVNYTQTLAAFDGRVSNAFVSEGDWVTQGVTTLTELVSTGLYYAYFDVDEKTYLELRKLNSESLNNHALMAVGNSEDFSFKGRIDFVDNKIDVTTGTIRLRAAFDDKDNILTPGLFVRIMLRIDEPRPTVLVKETAIATDLNSKYVLVVDGDNMVQYRPVQTGARYGALRVITSGLEPNEQIVVSGLQRVFPGLPVAPETVEMADAPVLESLTAKQQALLHN